MDTPKTPPIHLAAKDGRPVSATSPRPTPAARKRTLISKEGRVGKSHKWEPTLAERKLIQVAIAGGMSQPQVAAVAGVSLRTLQTRCRKELNDGGASVNARVVRKLYEKCMKGDTIALLFWAKSRLGWNDRPGKLEITGKDGGPIQHETIAAEADAFTQRIASMADRFAAIMASDADAETPANDGESIGEKICSPSSSS